MDYDRILKYQFARDRFEYRIGLRNERKFEIGDQVFLSYNDHDLVCGTVVGVLKTADENPDYIYTVQVPEAWVYEVIPQEQRESFFNKDVQGYTLSRKCNNVFSDTNQAKQSAIDHMNHLFKVQRDEIERYFSRFGIEPTKDEEPCLN